MKNSLYYGDNLEVLRKHIRDETVDLCYIDPPFNSKRNYNQIYNNIGREEDRAQAQAFVDTWTWDAHANECFEQILSNENRVQTQQSIELIGGLERVLGRGSLFAYLVSMTARIAEIHRTLKPTGSFYLHCDPTASHYLKLICDAIFCGARGGFYKNEISWKRTSAHSDVVQGAKHFGRIHDVVFYYSKSDSPIWNTVYLPYSKEYVERIYRYSEPDGRRYQTQPLHAAKAGGDTLYEWKGAFPPKGRYWAFSKENMEKLDAEDRIVYSKNGVPRYKIYLNNSRGVPLQDVWTDITPLHNLPSERLGYPTQKPEALLERIISASSNEGDTILDAYCGCGTTVAVAQRLKRNWIGIDITYQSVALVLRRLESAFGKAVLDTITLNGIPRDMKSAVALANKKDDRLRKEFEKWAALTYTNNRAIINDRKGADRGIDGVAYFMTGKRDNAKIIIQVKSGGVKRNDIATLRGDMEREKAALAVFITLEKATKPMIEEAKAAGQYTHEQMGRNYDRIQIVTIEEILEQDKRLDIPMSLEVLKNAQRETESNQMSLIPAT